MSQGRVAMHVHSLGEEERGGTKHNPEKCLAEQGCRVGKGGGHSSALQNRGVAMERAEATAQYWGRA